MQTESCGVGAFFVRGEGPDNEQLEKGSLPTVDKFEKQALLKVYRTATPAMQAAAQKLLDLPEPKTERSSTSRTG